MKPMLLTLAAAAATLGAGASQAHVVLSPAAAAAGGYYVGEFRVSHGCGGAATTALSIELPPQVVAAKPQPKPGWTVDIAREPLDAPVAGEGGRPVRDRVRRITWRGGPLPDDEFDSFGVMLKLPAQPQSLAFVAVQRCGAAEVRWDEGAPSAGSVHGGHPAPRLDVAPAAGDAMAGMAHGG